MREVSRVYTVDRDGKPVKFDILSISDEDKEDAILSGANALEKFNFLKQLGITEIIFRLKKSNHQSLSEIEAFQN